MLTVLSHCLQNVNSKHLELYTVCRFALQSCTYVRTYTGNGNSQAQDGVQEGGACTRTLCGIQRCALCISRMLIPEA